jgi:tungstate transport system ATP-binding protein
MSVAYTLQDVRQIYGQRTVLQLDSLKIHQGETFTLVGPSGAGKSTLLRLLALLERPTHGTVALMLNNQSYTHDNLTLAVRRRLGMVFQQPALLSRSVRYNIAYGLTLRGQRNWQPAVNNMLERVSLTQVADAPAHTLSGGEKQRVAIARALVLNPDMLILDEPTANLDPYNIRIIEDLVRESTANTTVIMVTHNIFQARRLADRVALLLEGELVEIAPNEQFFNQPQDKRTAAFVNGDLIY